MLMFRYLCILSYCREKDSEEKGDKRGDMAVSPAGSSPWQSPHSSGGSPFRMGQAVAQVAAQCCGTPAQVGELGKLWGERGESPPRFSELLRSPFQEASPKSVQGLSTNSGRCCHMLHKGDRDVHLSVP